MLGDGTVGWTAAAYFANFWVYLITSVGELIAWCFYMFGSPAWFGWWTKHVGWWGAMYFAGLTPLFAALQLGLDARNGGLAGDSSVEFGFNAIFLITIGMTVWF